MDALKALESRSYDSGATVRFRDVDYNVLTFREQIKIDLGERLQPLFLSHHLMLIFSQNFAFSSSLIETLFSS